MHINSREYQVLHIIMLMCGVYVVFQHAFAQQEIDMHNDADFTTRLFTRIFCQLQMMWFPRARAQEEAKKKKNKKKNKK